MTLSVIKKAVVVAALAAAGFATVAGTASAVDHPGKSADNNTVQQGLIPVNALNNVNVSPNLGCVANRPLEDLNAQSLVGIVPVAVDVDEALKQPHINVLSNGNVSTTVVDDSCTSNQGSSQAGDNTHGATGAGSSSNGHAVGNAAGSENTSGNGAGGLVGSAGKLALGDR
ncbi:hypothetical protein [Kibdelosporangium phytohabitans]|uniref:Chaplin domain-containing protein n=1 Tax=Kibdelosporangium phytohabitans TaxID=860235 RepID=A0A0N9IEZ1_9PSEU|nr:hypothetical protein [Kibdelosporangium phytohabitans]ALG13373.1 hypothetical protein AOZ06_46750 [Kibdelosporangium phytohabitans]MBE1465163.1 hypothetical protein [Kibdelosporangium phytohabitans]